MKIKAIILRNELEGDQNFWVKACEDYRNSIDYRVVDLTEPDWLEEIQKERCDILLAKPGGITSRFKQLYDERIFILAYILGYRIFPSPIEIFLYENKRFLSYWLKANNIPHPETKVFYRKAEAFKYLEECKYPFVAKTNIGASGSGVIFINNRKEGEQYIERAFSGKGVPRRVGPNLEKGRIIKRGLHYLFNPYEIGIKFDIYNSIAKDPQKGYVIFQQYIPHEFEWRVVRIGESFFAHKKLKKGNKASGSLLKLYDNPPLELLDFVKNITDRHGFYSQAIDIFEYEDKYLINEMQCIFGQSDPYQMLMNGEPGRYRNFKNKWIFEEGDYAKNSCFNLRIEFIIDYLFNY